MSASPLDEEYHDPENAVERISGELEDINDDDLDGRSQLDCEDVFREIDVMNQAALQAVDAGDWDYSLWRTWHMGLAAGAAFLRRNDCVTSEIRLEQVIEHVAGAAKEESKGTTRGLIQTVRSIMGEIREGKSSIQRALDDDAEGQRVACAAPGDISDVEEWLERLVSDGEELDAISMSGSNRGTVSACAVISEALEE